MLWRSLKRLYYAFFHSLDGIYACMKSEQAFRLEIYFSLAFIPLGLWLGKTDAEKILLIGSIFLVLIVEVLNSAIERVVDRISSERHALSKEAKDMGSAAVFLSLVLWAVTWALILFF